MKFYCVYKMGGDYGTDYVSKLHDSITKFLPDVEFVCLSDDQTAIGYSPLIHNFPGWWSKMELFRPDIEDDILYMDLDTVVCNDLTEIKNICLKTSVPIMLEDFYVPRRFASGIMWLPKQFRSLVWDNWISKPEQIMSACEKSGDQKFIGDSYHGIGKRWQDILGDKVILSWKQHCTKGLFTKKCCVVCYHGKPRPRDTGWAVTQNQQKSLIKFKCRPVTQTEENLIIVASGPSSQQYFPLHGWKTIAVNNAISLNRMRANYWFTLDPSAENYRLMINQKSRCYYYAALPLDYGLKNSTCIAHRRPIPHNVHILQRIHDPSRKLGIKFGLSENPQNIHTGNSAYGALGLAYLMKPKRIIMVGVDGSKDKKFDGKHCDGSLDHLPALFESAKPQLDANKIEVVNASKDSLITCFPRMTYSEAIEHFRLKED